MKKYVLALMIIGCMSIAGCSGKFWGGAVSGVAGAGAGYEYKVKTELDRIQTQLDNGEITQEEGLLLKFQYVFYQQRLPAEFRPAEVTPLKCGTAFIVEFMATRGGLSSATVEAIEGYLAGPAGDQSRAIYISPSG